ncbi:MAG: HAD family phosphatase [Clostridia bacterium]|nr:HAD family phosphatase [Clostridia bacterium]
MIKGAIFDLDGTLLDSMHVWQTFGTDYLKTLGIEAGDWVNKTVMRMSLEEGTRFLREEFNLDVTSAQVSDGINRMVFDEYKNDIKVKDGVPELLEYLKNRGVKMCIATATDIECVEAALEHNGILDYFGRIYTCTMIGKGKNEPDIYEKSLEFLGTDKKDTIVFEDAYHCVKTAVNAGFRVLGIYDRYEPEGEKTAAMCDWFVNDIPSITGILESL